MDFFHTAFDAESAHWLGRAAALGTAACWTVSALSFEAAGKRIGSLSLNLIRLVQAALLLSIYTTFARGQPLPFDASPHAWVWLTVSGLVGFVFGDLCLFRALVLIGARKSMLMMSLAPVLAAIIGWLTLGETIGPRDLAGMAITLAGVAWVVLERARPGDAIAARVAGVAEPAPTPEGVPWKGITLAFGGALGQAGGLVIGKFGVADYDPFAATQIRIYSGIAGFALVITALRWWPNVAAAMKNRTALLQSGLGATFGPFIGVSLSLLAVQHAATGVAATLMALTPVLIIPVAIVVRNEHVSLRAWAGALVAVSGVGLLFSGA